MKRLFCALLRLRFFRAAIIHIMMYVAILLSLSFVLGSDHHAARSAGHESAVWLRFILRFAVLLPATLEYGPRFIKQFLCNDWLVFSFVQLAAIFEQPYIERIGEDKSRSRLGDSLSGTREYIVLRQKGRHIFQPHITLRVFLKYLSYDLCSFLVHNDCFCTHIVDIPHRR